ncbi:hypothetical protein ACIBF1_45110 [Spirillospora sp. NPDC050679]
MVFELIESAQARRRLVDAPHLFALVCAGAAARGWQTRRTADERAA